MVINDRTVTLILLTIALVEFVWLNYSWCHKNTVNIRQYISRKQALITRVPGKSYYSMRVSVCGTFTEPISEPISFLGTPYPYRVSSQTQLGQNRHFTALTKFYLERTVGLQLASMLVWDLGLSQIIFEGHIPFYFLLDWVCISHFKIESVRDGGTQRAQRTSRLRAFLRSRQACTSFCVSPVMIASAGALPPCCSSKMLTNAGECAGHSIVTRGM